MRALYIYTHGFPEEDGHSTAARLSWLQLTLLARRGRVDLLALIPLNQSHAAPSPALAILCKHIVPILLPPTRALGIQAVLSRLLLGQPPALSLKKSAKAASFLAEALRQKTYDIIVTNSAYGLVNLPPGLLRKPESTPVCVVNEEVQWTAWRSYCPWQVRAIGFQQALQSLLWPAIKSFERHRYRLVREVLCLSEREKQAVLALDPAIHASLIPLPAAVQAPAKTSPGRDSSTILFTGGFAHPPNRMAALELVQRILPLVRKEIPSARLCLAGKGASSLHGLAGASVELVDSAPSLTPFYQSVAVTAGPIRAGEGVRGKFLEALACGCPVITTPLGASGIQVTEDQGLIVCETPLAFAGAIVRLLRFPALRQRLGEAGSEAVKRHHSPLVFSTAFNAALDRALVPKGGPP